MQKLNVIYYVCSSLLPQTPLHEMEKVVLSTLNFKPSDNDDLIYCSDVTMPFQNISLDHEL